MEKDLTVQVIEKIESLAAPQLVEVDGEKYSKTQLYRVHFTPHIVCSTIGTLTGLVDYLRNDPDKIMSYNPIIHIMSPHEVSLKSNYSGETASDLVREHYVTAVFRPRGFAFGQYMAQEDFIIGLMTRFSDSSERADLLSLVGNLTDVSQVKSDDTGVTQMVESKTGIHVRGETVVKPIWNLRPFRTFLEVIQPESSFLLRVRKGSMGPEIALFEADGGMWELEAIQNIAAHLRAEFSDEEITILA